MMVSPTAGAADPAERVSLELELGAAQLQKNELQSPNDASATRFDLARVLGTDSTQGTGRVTVRIPAAGGDEWLAVYAPLTFEGSATLDQTVVYEGRTFAGAPETRASYRFDTYRLTWRRAVIQSAETTVRLGVTGLVRDAAISLSQAGVSASRSNTGLVPLLHGSLERRLGSRISLIGDVDALGSGQGYAVDLSLRAQYVLDTRWAVSAGYRMLDGGADNDTLYNFARIEWLTLGVRRSF
ncbi:MAG: hypothetical protein O9318_12490 [Hylemonella sp.]|nr:hypothetical protein [Hylemonella sp.]